jgi:hypothetical protein
MRSFGNVPPAREKLEGGLPIKRGEGVSGAQRMNTMSNARAAVLKLLVSPKNPQHNAP